MPTASARAAAGACCDDPADAAWGRLPGAEPPLRWWLPALLFAATTVALTLVVVLVVRSPGPRDDPDPAYQRDGLLLNGPTLPEQVGGVRFGGRPVVVLFDRRLPAGPRFDAWRAQVSDDGVDLVVSVAGTTGSAALADAVDIPAPVDGGPPVGYAVVDPGRTVRYSTLDPAYLDNPFEVDVITGAVRDAHR